MNRIAYDKTRILLLTPEGLQYSADDGSQCFIDFEVCRQNFQLAHGNLGGDKLKYVGFRDLSAQPPHITLWTNPPTRFEFRNPLSHEQIPDAKLIRIEPEIFHEFLKFQLQLFKAGAQTGDLS